MLILYADSIGELRINEIWNPPKKINLSLMLLPHTSNLKFSNSSWISGFRPTYPSPPCSEGLDPKVA